MSRSCAFYSTEICACSTPKQLRNYTTSQTLFLGNLNPPPLPSTILLPISHRPSLTSLPTKQIQTVTVWILILLLCRLVAIHSSWVSHLQHFILSATCSISSCQPLAAFHPVSHLQHFMLSATCSISSCQPLAAFHPVSHLQHFILSATCSISSCQPLAAFHPVSELLSRTSPGSPASKPVSLTLFQLPSSINVSTHLLPALQPL